MRILGVVVLLLTATSVAFSQQTGSVEGIVLFEGKPVDGATVKLGIGRTFDLGIEAKTDGKGRFRLTNLKPGNYSIIANAALEKTEHGRTSATFAEAILDVVIVAGSTADLTFNLAVTQRSSVYRLQEFVEISADVTQPASEVSKTFNLIEAGEMRERADFTLVDTLRTIPGFRIQQLGGFGRTASIKSRGLRNQDTAVLIDGIRFRDPGSITGDATPFLSDFTLTSVSRLEVLRGSGSSLYGTNAIGGTIDFQTPRPLKRLHGQIAGAAGGLGLGRFRGNLSYGADKFGVSGAISRTAYTKGIDGEDNAGNTNVQSRVEFYPTSETNISGRFFLTDSRVRLNTSPDTLGMLPPPGAGIIDALEGVNFVSDANDPDSIQEGRSFVVQLSATHALSRRLTIAGHYQGLDTDRKNFDGTLGFQSEFTSGFGGTIHTANIRTVWTPAASNTFTAGYEFETEQFQNEGSSAGGSNGFTTRAGQRSNTLYAQHLVGFFDGRLQFAGGARGQWFSLERPEFSVTTGPYANLSLSDPPAAYTFDGSASYFFSSTGTKLRMHVGNGYRVPSLYERFGTFFFSNNFFPQGNPDLKPERSLGIDAGVDQYFANERVKASATYFYTRISDEITYLPTDDFGAPAYYNFDRHYSRGAELSIDIKPTDSTTVFASYTFINSDIRNFRRPTIVTLSSTDRRAFGIPDHQFTMVVTQRIKRFWISADALATSSYLAPVFSNTNFSQYTYRFNGNRRVDLTAGYTFPIREGRMSLRLFGTIENLFDHEYFENGFRTVPRNGRVGLSFGF